MLFTNLAFITECGAPIEFGKKFAYDLKKPDEKYMLKKKLAEVSGLSFLTDSTLVLVEDEVGAIFSYNLKTNTISDNHKFAKKGDFEDVETLGNTAYVLRSDGTLYEINDINSDESILTPKIYDTPLSVENDTEGLCYDQKNHSLLIGCKGVASLMNSKAKYFNKRAIYSFNLRTKKLSQTPAILIDEKAVAKHSYAASRNGIEKLMSFYNLTPTTPYEPSGMAFHPITNDLFIISSSSNLMIVIDSKGTLKSAHELTEKVFKQPEGIVFDSKGNLYISNEGRGGKGNILKFLYDPEQ